MRILFTICARAGSKGIKNKNISNFLGRPLVYYTLSAIELYINNNCEHDYIVALNTDSDELVNIANAYKGLNIIHIHRTEELAGDVVAKKDVIMDTLIKVNDRTAKECDIVIDLDITSPLRRLCDIDSAIKLLIEKNCDVVFSGTGARRNPYFNMVMDKGDGYVRVIDSDVVARQQAKQVYDMNASIYVYDSKHLMQGKGVLEGYNEMILMPDTGILDLDNEEDFELLELVARYYYDKYTEYRDIVENII